MLDGKAYQAHFPDDPAYDPVASPRLFQSVELMVALAALETEFRSILKVATAD
jgi:hypothetical protein